MSEFSITKVRLLPTPKHDAKLRLAKVNIAMDIKPKKYFFIIIFDYKGSLIVSFLLQRYKHILISPNIHGKNEQEGAMSVRICETKLYF